MPRKPTGRPRGRPRKDGSPPQPRKPVENGTVQRAQVLPAEGGFDVRDWVAGAVQRVRLPLRQASAMRMLLSGMTRNEVARQLGVATQTINAWMRDARWIAARQAIYELVMQEVALDVAGLVRESVAYLRGAVRGDAGDESYHRLQAAQTGLARLSFQVTPPGADGSDPLDMLAPADPDAPLSAHAAAELAEAMDIRALALPATTPEAPATPSPATETLVSVSSEHDAAVLDALDATPDPLADLRPSPWADEDEADAGDGWRSWR